MFPHDEKSGFRDRHDWVGTKTSFQLKARGLGEPQLFFPPHQLGPFPSHGACSSIWSYFLGQSLRQMLRTGHGLSIGTGADRVGARPSPAAQRKATEGDRALSQRRRGKISPEGVGVRHRPVWRFFTPVAMFPAFSRLLPLRLLAPMRVLARHLSPVPRHFPPMIAPETFNHIENIKKRAGHLWRFL